MAGVSRSEHFQFRTQCHYRKEKNENITLTLSGLQTGRE